MTPLFKTQPNDYELGQDEEECEENEARKDKNSRKQNKVKSSRNQSVMSTVSSVEIDDKKNEDLELGSSLSKNTRAKSNGKSSSIQSNKKNNRNFIKRNIQVISML